MNRSTKHSEQYSAKLPLQDNGKATQHQRPLKNRIGLLKMLPVAVLIFAIGGFVGLYFQPPGLQMLMKLTGLSPGAGNSSPIAVPVAQASSPKAANISMSNTVVALGTILPLDDVITIATPFGAGDARVESLLVSEGESVAQGALIATMDNATQLRANVTAALSSLAVKEAQLTQVKNTILHNQEQANADMQRAMVVAEQAEKDSKRAASLRADGLITEAEYERLRSLSIEAQNSLQSTQANAKRYAYSSLMQQPDIQLASSNLEAARVYLQASKDDLQKSQVIAPSDGVILSINSRVGERPAAQGIVTMGNTSQMQVKMEVYQSDIHRVKMQSPVSITAPALGNTVLYGQVSNIGLQVRQQQLIALEPAANTDARIIYVTVTLKPQSAAIAGAYTGLEVTATIDSGEALDTAAK